jgi:hypothetical protein
MNGAGENRVISRDPFKWIAAGNLLAVPLFWQELVVVSQVLIANPTGAIVAALVTALAVAFGVAAVWRRSVRAGAVLQIIVLIPSVIRLIATYSGWSSLPAASDAGEFRFYLGMLLIVVVPGALLAISILALRRRHGR